MTTKILGNQITSYTIDTVQLSNTATAAFAKTLAPKVLYANVANSLYFTVDDTAVNVGGGYIVVTGAEFQSGATVLIDTTPASAVTYVNSTTLQVQVPTKSAASYNLYVVNPDGGVGIKVSGITYSSEPTWVTSSPLANQSANTAFGVNLSATGATSYSVAAGSTLPAGTSLAANGYFSGTVTIGSETTYTFSVVATDAELQDSSKTFQVTVTVTPQYGLWAWGGNFSGNLGLNDTAYRSSPTQVGALTDWTSISNHGSGFIAIKTNGTLWTSGRNHEGQLGLNDTINRSSPVQVGSNTNWRTLSASGSASAVIAIKTDGTLWAWGRNNEGSLAQNDRIYRSSPVQIGTSTDWSSAATGSQNILAIKTNGTLWGWGHNPRGQLGLNDTASRSSPVQIGVATNWSKVSTSTNNTGTLALKTNGTIWSWGGQNTGNLGTNDVGDKSSPTQIGTGTDWSQINATHPFYFFAIKTNGTLWVLGGSGLQGQLGLNGVTYRSSPTQIGTDTNWRSIQASSAVFATKTNGTLWGWGNNAAGNLGFNDTVARSSPTQIGSGTNWGDISPSGLALRSN